ncbi:MAG TPA: hypothetical protein VF998_05180 [Candidatus Limnocylindria bacterium]
MDEPLVDFICGRETHQRHDQPAVISMRGGALALCPSGETVGHVWRAAWAMRTDDWRLLRETGSRGRTNLLLRNDH